MPTDPFVRWSVAARGSPYVHMLALLGFEWDGNTSNWTSLHLQVNVNEQNNGDRAMRSVQERRSVCGLCLCDVTLPILFAGFKRFLEMCRYL